MLHVLSRFDAVSLGTLQLAAATLATLAAGVDDDTYAPPLLRPALARAAQHVATALKRGEPPFTTDLDSVCADVANWTRSSYARRRRRVLGAVFSGDDDFF
ncbi:MAG: hypothetical protein AAF449_08785, partial [Myxococcota bacterium]